MKQRRLVRKSGPLLPLVSTVIVVDDRSTDDTARTAGDAGAFVVRHEKNTGYDDSLNDGFKAAASLGADIIFTFDADGEHDAADVPLVLAPYFRGRRISLRDSGLACGIGESGYLRPIRAFATAFPTPSADSRHTDGKCTRRSAF